METEHEFIGNLFAERYQIRRLLGKGGMGKVYLASDTILNEDLVALKLLHADIAEEEKHVNRFIREVQLTRVVSNPHIVRTYDVGIYNGRLFFAMEYVEGDSLKDLLSKGPIDFQTLTRYLMQACEGLAAIHAESIIHRDLKPANMLLSKDETLKITDFGVARPGASDMTAFDEVVGSATYMAPEVWTGKNIGPASDLYALGISAFELLTGSVPFEADSAAELMWKHIEEEIEWPEATLTSTPVWLVDLINILLMKDCNQRPCSAEEIKRYLERCFAGDVPQVAFQHHDPLAAPVAKNDSAENSKATEAGGSEPGYYDAKPAYYDEAEGVELGIGAELPKASRLTHEDVRKAILSEESMEEYSEESSQAASTSFTSRAFAGLGRFLKAAVLTAIFAFLLIGPTGSALLYFWHKFILKPDIMQFVFIGITVVIHSSLLISLPVFFCSGLIFGIRRAFSDLLLMVSGVSILIVLIFSFNLTRLSYEAYEQDKDIKLKSIISIVEPGTINALQAAMLLPQSSRYKAEVAQDTVILKRQIGGKTFPALDHVLTMLLFSMLAVMVLSRLLSRVYIKTRKLLLWSSVLVGMVILLENFGIYFLKRNFGDLELLEILTLKGGLFFIPSSYLGFMLSLLNWLLMIAAALVLFKLVKRSGRVST